MFVRLRRNNMTGSGDNNNEHNKRKKRPLLSENETATVPGVVANITRLEVVHHNWNGGTTTTTIRLIRTLPPYLYTFTTFAKGRWVGRTVLDVYSDEFGSYPVSYYRAAIEQGRIQVNGAKVTLNYRIGRRDELCHMVHRHEPAVVVGLSISPYFDLVAETDEVVALDKPAAIPIHACGAYHRNSLVPILEDETSFGKLYTIHRLDRLTSGLVVLAKHRHVAQHWGRAMTDRTCEKIYLARVKGWFGTNLPSRAVVPRFYGPLYPILGEWTATTTTTDNNNNISQGKVAIHDVESLRKRNAYGYWITNGNGQACPDIDVDDVNAAQPPPWAVEHSLDALLHSLDNDRQQNDNNNKSNDDNNIRWLTFACPVRLEQPKDGVCAGGPFLDLDDAAYIKTVKPAQTSFAVIRYFVHDDTTLIMARPATGRTHQIRLHLYHLGHAIANDPNYGGDMWFGDPEGRDRSVRAQQVLAASTRMAMSSTTPATEDEVCSATTTAYMPSLNDNNGESLEEMVQRTCVWCHRLGSMSAEQQAVHEFQVRSPGLWLHALRYRINKESTVVFQTAAPTWAVEEPLVAS